MIIKLQRVMHRHGRWIFGFLLAVIIVAFILWDYAGWSNRMDQVVSHAVVYGQRINHRDLETAKRLVQMHRDFMGRRNAQLTDREDALIEQQVLHRMALVEKARRLGFRTTDAEVLASIQQHPLFSQNGKFSKEAYIHFASEILPTRNLTEAGYEEMLREDILLRKLLTVVASTVKVTPAQVRSLANELAESVRGACCRFDASEFTASVRPSDAEVKAYFDAHGDQFRIPEKRKVAYVAFPIDVAKVTVSDKDVEAAYGQNQAAFTDPDGKVKPLKEVAERIRTSLTRRIAVQETGRRATDFTVKLVPEPGKPTIAFEALAKEAGVAVKETGYFAADERVPGIETTRFSGAAFRLSEDTNVSDPVEDASAIYVLRLLDRKPSEVPPFDGVKAQVRAAWVSEAALKAARDKGEEKRLALEGLLKEGKAIDQVARSLGVKVQTIKPFKMTDPMPQDFFEGLVRRVAVSVPVGGVSELVKQPNGGFFVVVTGRVPAPAGDIAQVEPQARMILMQSQQERVVADFEKTVIDEAQVRLRRPVPAPRKGEEDAVEM